MELTIKADNAEDLRNKVNSLAKQFGGGTGNTSNGTTAKTAPPTSEGSIFGGSGETAPTPIKGKGKKAAAPAPVETEAEDDASDLTGDTGSEEITRDNLADELRVVIAKCGGNAAREMMTKLGYDHLNKIPESGFAKFMAACKEVIKTKSKK